MFSEASLHPSTTSGSARYGRISFAKLTEGMRFRKRHDTKRRLQRERQLLEANLLTKQGPSILILISFIRGIIIIIIIIIIIVFEWSPFLTSSPFRAFKLRIFPPASGFAELQEETLDFTRHREHGGGSHPWISRFFSFFVIVIKWDPSWGIKQWSYLDQERWLD